MADDDDNRSEESAPLLLPLLLTACTTGRCHAPSSSGMPLSTAVCSAETHAAQMIWATPAGTSAAFVDACKWCTLAAGASITRSLCLPHHDRGQ